MTEMSKSVEGQARLDVAEERVNRALARYIEDHEHDDVKNKAKRQDMEEVEQMEDMEQMFEDAAPLQDVNESIAMAPTSPASSGRTPVDNEEDLMDAGMCDQRTSDARHSGDTPSGPLIDRTATDLGQCADGGSVPLGAALRHTHHADEGGIPPRTALRHVGVPGAMAVPADEAGPAETPVSETIRTAGEIAKTMCNKSYLCDNRRDGDICAWEEDKVLTRTAGEIMKAMSLDPDHCPTTDTYNDGDDVAMLITEVFFTGGKQFARDRRSAFKRVISEIYSPPRLTAAASKIPRCGILPGFAMDLGSVDDEGEPWDFRRACKREKALKLLRETKPFFLMGSPPCTGYCSWQKLNDVQYEKSAADVKRRMTEAQLHIDFSAMLYREQIESGRYFIHEHPWNSGSWNEKSIEQLLEVQGVERRRVDQCQWGAQVMSGPEEGSPVMKPSGIMSNAAKLLDVVCKRCRGSSGRCSRRKGGVHTHCEGKVARDAAIYSQQFCKALLRGMTHQMRHDGMATPGCVGVHAVEDKDTAPTAMCTPENGYSGRFKDDITGQPLKDPLVMEARKIELDYFNQKGVWTKRPFGEAKARTGRLPITVRWVDVNKGDELNPKYRSRLVARQLKARDMSGDNFFAPTPPLEALRTVISMCATSMGSYRPNWNPTSETRTQVSTVDVARAYFNAKCDPEDPCYVQLPAEDGDVNTKCGLLIRHMYGTRRAADGWQEEYSSTMVRDLGFVQGTASPNLFRHKGKGIVCSVHGDDFTSSGPKDALDWFEAELQNHYEVTIQPRLGPGPDDAKEVRVLNRIIRWCEGHLEYEADPRQAEKLVLECGLEGCKSTATPGVRASFEEVEKDVELPKDQHSAFRGAAARGNYLAADRLDCQFACKEVCRGMSTPTQRSWGALRRMCRYIAGLPRLVYRFERQEVNAVDCYTDTDWAGCPKTRKSTSGGCILLGSHTIKHWSSTQTSVSLSSGEAEFNGVVKGSGMALGYQSLLRDLGVDLPVRVWTDSSAAIGICSRQGLGKLRHLDTHTLWVQQAVRQKRIDLRKIAGERNPADIFTKHSLTREKLGGLVSLFSCHFSSGRSEAAPLLRTHESQKATMASCRAQLGDEPTVNTVQDLEEPYMPHRVMTQIQMDAEHPSVVVPEDDDDDFAKGEHHDTVMARGMEIATEIVEQMQKFGRTARVVEMEKHITDIEAELNVESVDCVTEEAEAKLNIEDDYRVPNES